jgi:hypothetical protein
MNRLAAFVILVGCSKSNPVTPAARDTFKARCAPCHGETGHGDGPALAKLPVKPPNFGDVTWQNSVTDEELRKAIVDGGTAVGKSPAMPAGRDLEPGVDALLALVRSFNGA